MLQRAMQRSDLEHLLHMSKENMRAIIFSSWGEEWNDAPLIDILTDPHIRTDVIEEDGTILAYYSLEPLEDYIFIIAFQVMKGAQGQGLGSMMLVAIEDEAREAGKEAIELCVQSTNNRARRFYYYRGYEIAYQNGNNIIMRKSIIQNAGQN